jgi:hypothetical protein
VYDKQVYSSPSGIRASLQCEDDSKTHAKPLPSSSSSACSRFALMSSWVGFGKELCISGTKEQLHLPVGFSLRLHMGVMVPPLFESAFVFRVRGSELGLLTFTRGLKTPQYVEALPVGEDIMQALGMAGASP